ncbi:nucleoid-associated protein YgaU [Aquimarina sp. EL_43]|uniref:peptidoglycan-binding protein LysM n=1 Tax=Aquimarina TaxID=290174 RepID=UPI000471E24C|nr:MULTISPECIES: peptidoglycan-binding protein LysM [Aquimarina]MBG6130910.1 nucleoid-associated protein YgaU [Aquimarina sp. EL_35]MBG6151369.1 nucleoid-associated protein YgaU [Aquimarina sp. EL_32]MBG6169300.1 nucleoid-associated protein YgaU [Aquimarina sp. EL_43]
MGLFSFIKGAGKKLFGIKDEAVKEEAVTPKSKTDLLKAEIDRLGIPVSGLDVSVSEMITVSGQTETNADREKIILAMGNIDCVGCVEDNITVTNPEPEAKFHVVKSGDTLSKISKEVYGDPMKYNVIFEANRPMLEHPDKIYPGQTLRIPVMS